MQQQFRTLRDENYLKGADPILFAQKGAGLINEINAAHPFIDGNGRTQRVWLRLVAENAGYSLDIRKDDREAWNDASRIGFLSSNEPMAQLIHSRLSITPQHIQLPSEQIAQPNTQTAENSLIEHVDNYKQRKALEREMAQPKPDQPTPAENQQPSAPNSENKPPRSSPGPSF
jgi:fido (protein-threonine AMPylation protein)